MPTLIRLRRCLRALRLDRARQHWHLAEDPDQLGYWWEPCEGNCR